LRREQIQNFKKIAEAEPAAPDGTLLGHRENAGVENIGDVLEEIWRTADRELLVANPGWCSGLLRYTKDALVRLKDDAFGVCLCCRTTIGLRRLRAAPWTPLCIRCQEAAGRKDAEALRIRAQGVASRGSLSHTEMQRK
jgi:RNA polymerase-binding transcription factor DksA